MDSFSVENLYFINSDYNIAIHRVQGNIVCCIWWDMKGFFNLEPDIIYMCPLNVTNMLSCPYWLLGFKKYESNMLLSLRCSFSDREVSFTLLTDGDQSPCIVCEGRERVVGTYSSFIPLSSVLKYADHFYRNRFLVMCKVLLYEEDMVTVNFSNPACSCSNLSGDLEKLFTSQKFCDVTLIKGDKAFLAHKSFLSARSSILKQTFECEVWAAKSHFLLNCDEIISNDAVEELLRYIYTGTTSPLNAELAIGLYHLSDILQLLQLQERCLQFLMFCINIKDLMRIYVFAISINSIRLETILQLFFYFNKEAVMKECYMDDGETMVRPSWIKPHDYIILDLTLKRLARSTT